MGLAELHVHLGQLYAQRRQELDRHAAALAGIERDLAKSRADIDLLVKGMSTDRIALGESLLEVCGNYVTAGEERAACVGKVMDEIGRGGGTLVHDYQGTKNYDRWHGQHIQCSYGCIPRHGSVIFSIGLRPAVRKRQPMPDDPARVLTAEEADACMYYLMQIHTIHAARAAAKVES